MYMCITCISIYTFRGCHARRPLARSTSGGASASLRQARTLLCTLNNHNDNIIYYDIRYMCIYIYIYIYILSVIRLA